MDRIRDCIIVGGGAAGLSAALVLGRARRDVVVVDSGDQSNRVAHGIGGLLGHEGRPPAELYAAGREELTEFPTIEVRDGAVASGRRSGDGFVLRLADGSELRGRRVLLATGMDYRRPELPGIEQRWGRSVFHCPFCHGWEVRDRALGVLDSGASGVHRALLLRNWSTDVTLLANGPAGLEPDVRSRLEAAGVAVDERPVAELRGVGDELDAIVFRDGGERPLGGLLVPVELHQRDTLAEQLAAVAAEPGPVLANALTVDERFQTGSPGVSAAGDLVQMPAIATAIAAGSVAAAMIVQSLIAEGIYLGQPATI